MTTLTMPGMPDTAGNNVNSFEDYQRLVGRHEGFSEILNIINEILTEDEDDL